MPDNVELDAGSGGAVVAAASLSISGDTAIVQMVGSGILSGSEGSWTYSHMVGGAGAVAAGVQRMTLASDDPAVAHLANIVTSVGTLDNAISGSEMQVDVVGALPAGTNAIGKLAANSGVDIGDVDVTSIIPGTGATNLGKAIDTALGATDTGVLAMAVRDDSLASLTEADGDVSVLRVDSTGRLWCNVSNTVTVASHAVTNAGTFAVQVDGNALTALQLIDNVVHADDAAFTLGTSSGVMMMGFAGTQSVDANDACALACTTAGALHVSDAGGSLTVDNGGTFAVQAVCTNGGTFAVQVDGNALTALQLIDNVVHVDDAAFTLGTSSGVMVMGFAGTQSVDANDACALACTTAGVLLTQPQGNVAHAAADSGNPVKIGAKAETSLKGITLAADGNRTDLYADADGVLMVKIGTSGADVLADATSNTDGASTASGVFTAVASTFNNITDIVVFRTDAGSSLAYIDFRDGTAGSVLWRMPLPAGSGSAVHSVKPLFKTSANTALAYDVSAALSTVYINVSGYQSKV